MKKLKVVLTLLLALCCSLCMFACGGAKNISGSDITGQKLSFKEGEEFSVGPDIKVVVYYQGDDNGHELKPEEYDVDSSAYNKDLAGEYAIYIIPKNQPKELTEGGKDNRWKYYYSVTVEHDWQDKGNGQYECSCGAKRNNYAKLNDQITTVAWGQQAVFTPGAAGETYPDAKAPIPGENHVSYGSLVKGQSLKLSIQITGLTRTDNPATASAWDTPLMGIRNATVGMLPREDGWVIGVAAGFSLPETSNVAAGGNPVSGLATAADAEWTVYGQGTTWSAGSAFPKDGAKNNENLATDWSKVDVEYIYQADDIFMIRHTLHKFDGTDSVYTVTTKVPDNAYEVVVYGEYCNFTITAADFVAGRAIETFEVTKDPTNTVQPEGKLFDTTGLGTKAVFSDKGELTNSYNAYAFHDVTPAATDEVPNPTPVKTRVSLGTTPLTADMYDFMVEFNGKQAWLTKDGKESTDANKATNQKITVVPTPVKSANTSVITVGETAFEAPDVTYDYTVTSTTDTSAYIKFLAEGSAVKATDAQKAALGDATHFIAFKLVTTLTAEEVAETIAASATGVVVKAAKAGNTVDVVLGLKEGFAKTFDLSLNETTKVLVDLNGLAALSKYGAEITESDFTLDAGGTYTVEYTGLGSAADINKLILPVVAKRDTVETVKAAAKGTYTTGTPTEDNSYKASNSLYITKVDVAEGKLTVTYWLAAPELGNLTAAACTTAVSLRDGETTLATANLTYKLEVSDKAIEIGDGVYVKANGNKLQVYTFTNTNNVAADKFSLTATLNVEHVQDEEKEPVYTMMYNVSIAVKVEDGVVSTAFTDNNTLTGHGSSAAKLIVLGTVNNTEDYDKGAILVANLHLPALGLREGSANREQVYHFTANENTAEGQTAYNIYKVDANTITSTSVTPEGERKEIQGFDCLTDGVSAFEYTDGNSKFYYGALVTPASGAHNFGAYVENVAECSVCGAKSYLFDKEGEDGYSYNVVALPANKPLANGDTSDSWDPWVPVAATDLSGDFVVTFQYDLVRDSYVDAVIQMVNHGKDGDTFGTFNVNGDNGPWAGDPITKGLKYSVKLNGETVEALPDSANNGFIGTHKITFIRINGKITAYSEFTSKTGTEGTGTDENGKNILTGQKLPWTKTNETHYEITYTGFADTTDDMTIQISGNPYWCDNLAVGRGSVIATKDVNIVVGAEDNSTGYTDVTPIWTFDQELKPGMKVETVGTMTNDKTQVWECGLAYIDTYLNLRPDNWINGTGTNDGTDNIVTGNTDLLVDKNFLGFYTQDAEGAWAFSADVTTNNWFAVYEPYIKSGQTFTQTTIWDWTDSSKIVITYYIQGVLNDKPVQFRQAYTIHAAAGAEFDESYKIGLGADKSCYKVSELTVTTV